MNITLSADADLIRKAKEYAGESAPGYHFYSGIRVENPFE
jgi:hypothetical protein